MELCEFDNFFQAREPENLLKSLLTKKEEHELKQYESKSRTTNKQNEQKHITRAGAKHLERGRQ